jgi:hypothetical protein
LPPALVAGNKRNIEVYLIDSAGNYDARSGASDHALSIGAGPIAGTPSSGTFTLTDGTVTTTALAHNASAQAVEDALNALNSSAGPFSQLVDVTSTYDGNYLVKFRTTGAVAALSGDASELSPQSAVVVDEARAGDGSTKEQQYIRLLRQPAIFQDSFTQIANGWSGELSANNARVLELMAGRDTIAIPLDVELTETGNEPETIARGNMLLSNEVINPASIDPANLAQLLTQALGDARYLRTTNNLSDVTDAATARSNIGAAAAADLTAHTDSTSNPHSVTAAQVGLGNVDNTSDADKPVSTAQQTALDLKADDADLTAHTDSTSNPHSVTAAQVGLGNVDNTSDADKPVSTAQQTSLDLKANDADLTAHTGSTSNPHGVTAAQVGLGNVDNTSDANKPVSTAQQTALDLKADATALTTETNARIDADNRREFAGGVYFDKSASAELPVGSTNFGKNDFSIFFETINHIDAISGQQNFFNSHSTSGNNRMYLYAFTSNSLNLGFRDNNGNVSVFTVNNIFTQKKDVSLLVTLDRDNLAKFIINGVTVGSVDISSTADIDIGLGNNNPPTLNIGGNSDVKIKNVAIFNTALTATQAAELYQQGLQPWLAANPEYRRGGDLIPFDDFSSSANWNTSSNWTISAGVASYDALAVNNLIYNISDLNYKIGDTIKVSFNSTASGKIQFREGTGNTTINPQNDSIFSSSFADVVLGSNEIIFNSTQASSGFAIRANTTNAYSIDNLQVTLIGSLATLPLDDDCRQLKDISGNRNDATASESGVTHLKEKDLHAFRDDHADGTGGSYLIANADIIAENEVITGVTVDGRFYAASGDQDLTKRRIKLQDHGSHVDVKRSNGTTEDSAIAVTNPNDGTDFAISVLTQRI